MNAILHAKGEIGGIFSRPALQALLPSKISQLQQHLVCLDCEEA